MNWISSFVGGVGRSFPHPGHLQQSCVAELMHDGLSQLAVAPHQAVWPSAIQPCAVPMSVAAPPRAQLPLCWPLATEALPSPGCCWQQALSCRARGCEEIPHQPPSLCHLWKAQLGQLTAPCKIHHGDASQTCFLQPVSPNRM